MKNTTIDRQLQKNINVLFDHFYQVNELTKMPGHAGFEEVLFTYNGYELKLKHLAAYMAAYTIEERQPFDRVTRKFLLRALIADFKKNSPKTLSVLDYAFKVLIQEVVALN